MELFTYFSGTLPFVLFCLLSMFHVFIRPKLSLVWTMLYIICFGGLVPVISVVIFSIYKFQTVVVSAVNSSFYKFQTQFPGLSLLLCTIIYPVFLSLLPCIIIIYSVFRLLYSVEVDLGGYHWREICLILIVLSVWKYITNWYMVRKLRWIRRECRLLDAICYDISKTLRIRENLDDTLRQTSTLSPETIRLPQQESKIKELEKWVKKTKGVVEANANIHSRQRFFFRLCKVVFISNDVSQRRKEFDFGFRDIYKKLENWRSMQLSLEENVIQDESGSASLERLENQLATIVREVTENLSGDRQKLKLVLLGAFLKDLKHVKLEYALERAWLEELEYILDDIHNAFETFRKRNKVSGLHRLLEKELLGRDVGWMADGLIELLEAKKTLGFKFTIVQQQTHPHQNDDVDKVDLILSIINKIHHRPRNEKNNLFKQAAADAQTQIQVGAQVLTPMQAQAEVEALELEMINWWEHAWTRAETEREADLDPEIESLCKKLENMHNRVKAIDSASSFRWVCLEQVDEAFQKYVEETHPVKLETSRIESLIKDLEIFIAVHNHKVRPKYSSIIGLEEDMDVLISKLKDPAGSEQRRDFSIVGMQGIGKRTLARKVYYHREISDHFEIKKWVSIPNNKDALLENVGNKILTTDASQEEQQEGEIEVHYSHKVRNFLQQQRYLVVLDNVPTMEVWNVIEELFPKEGNRSRILLTTSDMTLALHVDSSRKPHQLRLRTKEESWESFLEKARLSTKLLPQNKMLVNTYKKQDEKLIKQAKQVVESCWGLPYVISRIGIQTFRNTVHSRSELLSGAAKLVDQYRSLWSETSQKISSLPDNLKSLLSYFSLFPENCEIPARRLIALWVAEGLVQPENDKEETLENIAEDCLVKLIGLNIVQPVARRVHGKVSICRLPDPLRNEVSHLAKITFSDKVRLADHCNRSQSSFELIHGAEQSPDKWQEYKNLISLISFDIHKGDKPGMDIGNFLGKGIANGCFKKLSVLDLEGVFRPQLPETIGKLSELRYLGLRWTYLEKIPSTIGHLSKLQTLDLKRTYIHTLPVTIWKLHELRHLYLNQTYRSKFVHQSKAKSLGNLLTLWGVFLDENSPLKDRLDELKSLRKLGLAFQLRNDQQVELARRISNLKHLQSLKLKSVGIMSEPQGLHLEDFSGLSSLSNIYLFGKLDSAFQLSKLPNALSDLTLSSSGLKDDPMSILGKLPNLKSLCLFSDSYIGEGMVCSGGCFPHLLVLKIWKLVDLKYWTIEEEAMQNLKELEIRCCEQLNVPYGFEHLKTLRQLKLRNMLKEFHDKCSAFFPLSIIDTKNLSNQALGHISS